MLALPKCRRPRERQERAHLAITLRLVPERPEFRRRHDAVAAWRLGALPHCRNGIPVEPSALHREVENIVHDRPVVIDAGR